MTAASPSYLYEQRAQAEVIMNSEIELRRHGLDQLAALEQADRAQVVAQWARVLELSLLFVSVQEAVLKLGLRTAADVIREVERVDALVITLSRLDPDSVIRENIEALEPYHRLAFAADEPIRADMEVVVRSVQSLVLHCPIQELERAARDHAQPDLGHRCRLTYDGLRAFVARHSHPEREAITTAGHLYAEGRATVDEVAVMLGVSVPDVVALLEEQGFRRSVGELRLSEPARAERLEAIRRDRLARNGEPELSPSHVARDVIASQRIEGVDARPWQRG